MKRLVVGSSMLLCAAATLIVAATGAAPNEASPSGQWVVPRTEHGHPDLQGNWSNATMTPVQRPPGVGPVLTPEQVAALEEGRQDFIEEYAQASDPNREAPPEGGVLTGDPLFDGATGGTGGYNYFYIDAGDNVAMYDGEPRSSLVVDPPNGRIPALTEAAQTERREAAAAARTAGRGEYDNPESRPMGERCIISFGSNAGPPMLPNYFYNNNYTIVQTADHVMILTEMVHDVRIIRLGERTPMADHLQPYFGDSWGRWEGDTLVIETTDISPAQLGGGYVFPGGSENMKVTERLTRVAEDTINYEFTVEDPDFYTAPWSGQVPFNAQPGLVYEYACHEANYSLFNVLSGARAQEREGR